MLLLLLLISYIFAEINIGYIYTDEKWKYDSIGDFLENYLTEYHTGEVVTFTSKFYSYPPGNDLTNVNISVDFFTDFLKDFVTAKVSNIIGTIPESNYKGFNAIYANLNTALAKNSQMLWLTNYGLNSVCYMNIAFFNSLCLVSQASKQSHILYSYVLDV